LKSRTIPAVKLPSNLCSPAAGCAGKAPAKFILGLFTFDSTAQGNIGPVIEALMDEVDCEFSVLVPAF
jgi:uncharacterized protein YgbK (DUF1537 family)